MPTKTSERRFTLLLTALLVLLLVSPVVHKLRTTGHGIWGDSLVVLLMALVLAMAVPAMSGSRKTIVLAVVLAGPAILLRALDVFVKNDVAESVHLLATILFLVFAVAMILKHLFEAARISRDTICASLCAYMLLGVLWANLYMLIGLLDQGAFSIPVRAGTKLGPTAIRAEQFIDMLYYSFTTLTTLGYGDVTPTSSFARMFSVTEAVVGQVILVVLVARLVGLHVAQATHDEHEAASRSRDRFET